MTPDRDHDAAALEPAALELAPGKHVLVFLPSALWPLGWWRRLAYRVLPPGLWGAVHGRRVDGRHAAAGETGDGQGPRCSARASGPVTAEVDGRLLARGLARSAQACLKYSETDPWAVWARFRARPPGSAAGVDFECAFARDLLSAGLDVVSGAGDVRVRPGQGRTVVIELFTPAGTARFTAPAAGVRRFLEETRDLVPPGTEARHAGIDAGIAAILAAEGSL